MRGLDGCISAIREGPLRGSIEAEVKDQGQGEGECKSISGRGKSKSKDTEASYLVCSRNMKKAFEGLDQSERGTDEVRGVCVRVE